MPVGNPVFLARSRYALFLCLNFLNDFGGKTVAFLPPGPTSSGGEKLIPSFPPFLRLGTARRRGYKAPEGTYPPQRRDHLNAGKIPSGGILPQTARHSMPRCRREALRDIFSFPPAG